MSKAQNNNNNLSNDMRYKVMTKNKLYRYTYEYTDTFGGESNYSWVKRGVVHATSFKHAMRKARKELGLTGTKGLYGYFAGGTDWRPYNHSTLLTVLDEVDNA